MAASSPKVSRSLIDPVLPLELTQVALEHLADDIPLAATGGGRKCLDSGTSFLR